MDATHAIIVAEADEFGKPRIRQSAKNTCNLLDSAVGGVSEARP